jgi:hypothetical protein
MSTPRAASASAIVVRTRSAVPTGHRRFVDDQRPLRHPAPDVARGLQHVLHVRAAVLVGRRAHRDELHGGVADCGVDIGREAQAPRVHVAAIIGSRPGSWIGTPPLCSTSILRASMSTHSTSLPTSARHVPVTSPTYPVPIIVIFMRNFQGCD